MTAGSPATGNRTRSRTQRRIIGVTRDGDDRVIVKWAGVVLDINAIEDDGVVLEAYPYQPNMEIQREDWERGRGGPLKPGQVSTFKVRQKED